MARGFSTSGDVVRSTIDGQDLNAVWRDFAATLELQNNARDSLRSLLSFKTIAAGADIAQTAELDDFEEASEFGVPHSIRAPGAVLPLGFNFLWRDLAARYTWQFLVDADRAQVEAVHNRALEADNRQVFRAILGALLNNAGRVNPEGLPVMPLYNGDGTLPPEFNGKAFPGTHSHYIISGSATFDGGDIRDAHRLVSEHGFGEVSVGGRVIVFLNPNEAELARGFKKGADATDPYDFIPSASAPAYLTDQIIVGDRPPANYGRIPVIGSYGASWLSESALVPSGYVVAVCTYGADDQRNVIGWREHVRPELRGLRQLGGNPDYPLQESFYQRGFGTGVRQRGGAGVVQVKATGTYDVPAAYASVVA